MNYFSNTTELILEDDFSATRSSIGTNLTRIIALKKLTKLVVKCDHFSVSKVMKILCYTPNMHTLILRSMPWYQQKNDCTTAEQNEDFQLVSNTNTIKNVTCDTVCTLRQIKLLVALCPRIQQLTIKTIVRNLEPITRFLLDKTNRNTRHLCSLCLSQVNRDCFEELETLINSETLLDDYTSKRIGGNLYLWW
jgi:hypothetical protein